MIKKKCIFYFVYNKKILIILIILIIINIEIFLFGNRILIMKELNNINSNNTTLNQTRIKMERLNLLEFISKSVEKNMTFVKYIFFGNFMRFGNILITIKKIIFFCRIIGCKRIFLDKGIIWFIKKKIVDKKYKIIIESKDLKNIKFLNLIIDRTINFFYYFNYINPDLKIPLIKDEILYI